MILNLQMQRKQIEDFTVRHILDRLSEMIHVV